MKKILLLLLTASLLISNIVFMTSCDVEAEGGDESPSDAEAPAESESKEGRIYGDYQIITVTDEATIELVENMWCDDSWNRLWPTDAKLNDSNFKTFVMTGNLYLIELLEREDAIDLLLWRFDKYAHQDPSEDRLFGEAGLYIRFAFRNEDIRARMTEAQKKAVDLICERMGELRS